MHFRHCQSVSIALRLAATWLLAASVAACSPATPDPKPPLYAPIALTQVGSAGEFEFWAYPKDAHEKDVLMVGLRVKRNWDGLDDDATHALYMKMLNAKIRLKVTADRDGKPAQFRFYSEFDKAVQIRPIPRVGSADVRARMWGHEDVYDSFYLADLSRVDGGLYKLKVEVVEPNLDMEGMQAEVFVAFRLFGGK